MGIDQPSPDALACAFGGGDRSPDGSSGKGGEERFVLPERIDTIVFEKTASSQETCDTVGGGLNGGRKRQDT